MTKEQLIEKLMYASNGRKYSGNMSSYARKSIEDSRSSYPVSNLLDYCEGVNVSMVMTDMAIDEAYLVFEVEDVHEVIGMLMERYGVDSRIIRQKANVNYTPPKNGKASLSINTLLSVCSVLHCKLDFD